MLRAEFAIQLLFSVFVLLQVYDVVTTMLILKRGGRELNPVVRLAIEHFGTELGLVVVKALVLAALWWMALVNLAPFPEHVMVLLALCNAFYVYVVFKNIAVLRAMGGR